jgi:sporulation protein YlmC with PRC-barrel domain
MSKQGNFTANGLHKRAVVSLDDGQRIGYVEDLLLDLQALELAALVVKGDKGETVLPSQLIKAVGVDAVTVDSVSSTQSNANALPGVRPFTKLHNLKVVDSAGTMVGHLHDIVIDPSSGAIVSLLLRSGGVFELGTRTERIPVTDVRSFGDSLITVNEAVPMPVEPTA